MSDEKRRRDLAAIHIAKKELRLQDEAYRDVISRVSGGRTESSAALTEAERGQLLAAFGQLGWVNAAAVQPSFKVARKPQARLVWALWTELGKLGALDNPSREACRAFCARMAKTGASTDPDFLTGAQLAVVIEALKSMRNRAAFSGKAAS